MSVYDENTSIAGTNYSCDESDHDSYVFENERGDRYSEESSGYNIREKADPASKNQKYVRRFNPSVQKKVRVSFFPTSGTPNYPIKNAVSGAYQGNDLRVFRTGTKDEDLFYSVILATGEIEGGPQTLFYDNPEQFERHFMTKLSPELKNQWRSKNSSALIQANMENAEVEGDVIVK